MIVARTDARSVEGFDAAVGRAREYLAAGADMIFPEALESADEFARFAQAVDAPLLANMTEFGRSPLLSFDELAGLGYKAVIYPLTALRAAMRAAEEVLETLRDQGTQQEPARTDADPGRALRPAGLQGLGRARSRLLHAVVRRVRRRTCR